MAGLGIFNVIIIEIIIATRTEVDMVSHIHDPFNNDQGFFNPSGGAAGFGGGSAGFLNDPGSNVQNR